MTVDVRARQAERAARQAALAAEQAAQDAYRVARDAERRRRRIADMARWMARHTLWSALDEEALARAAEEWVEAGHEYYYQAERWWDLGVRDAVEARRRTMAGEHVGYDVPREYGWLPGEGPPGPAPWELVTDSPYD